jgi:hypothetical protein
MPRPQERATFGDTATDFCLASSGPPNDSPTKSEQFGCATLAAVVLCAGTSTASFRGSRPTSYERPESRF